MNGWLEIGESDRNLCGGFNCADIMGEDEYPFVDPSDVCAGGAYGIVASANPDKLLHSFVGIDSRNHVAVSRNCGRIVVGDNETVLRNYGNFIDGWGLCSVRLRAMKSRPAVIGTDAWKRAARPTASSQTKFV